MSRIRTAFFGTPDFSRSCLEALIKDEHFEVVGVVTQPDRPAGRQMKLTPSPVKALVAPLGIEVLTPESVNRPEVLEQIAKWRAEVCIVVAFGQILKQPLLDLFPKKIVNVHTSLLPRWRGAAPIQRSIMAGDAETGVCLQLMELKLDAGAVIGSRKIKLSDSINSMELHEALKPLAIDLLSVDLMDYLRGNLTAIAQDDSQVTYASKILKPETQLNWALSAWEIHNHVRGLAMGPFATTVYLGSPLKIHRTRVVEVDSEGHPGEIVRADEDGIQVQCGRGTLEILEVQPESRSRMAVAQYVRGYPIKTGDRLTC